MTVVVKSKIITRKRIILKFSIFAKKLSAYHLTRRDVWLVLRKLEEFGLIRLIPYGRFEVLEPAFLDWLLSKKKLKEKHEY